VRKKDRLCFCIYSRLYRVNDLLGSSQKVKARESLDWSGVDSLPTSIMEVGGYTERFTQAKENDNFIE
jgi:hypothetical protein